MVKIEFALNEGKLQMDVFKDIDGVVHYDFTQEDWKEAYTLMLKVTEYIRKDSNGGVVE